MLYYAGMLSSLQGIWQQVLGHAALWLVVILVMLLLRRRVHAWAEQRVASNVPAGDRRAAALLARIYAPVLTLVGLYLSLELVELPGHWQDRAEKALLVITYLVFTALAWRGFSMLVAYWARTNPNAGTLVPPVQLVGRLFIAFFTLALIFGAFDRSLTKVWTALGIGSIALALALQETLSNTFAGFYLMLDQPVRIGDYIKVESGEEGRVSQIGWRSTRLLSPANNVVVIPNAKLARASITNYSMPVLRLAVSLVVSAAADADSRRVAAVLEEVIRAAALEVDGMLSDPPPSVLFIPGFGEASLNFTLNCQVRDLASQGPVQNELRHRILERFRREGIGMAVPVRRMEEVRS